MIYSYQDRPDAMRKWINKRVPKAEILITKWCAHCRRFVLVPSEQTFCPDCYRNWLK